MFATVFITVAGFAIVCFILALALASSPQIGWQDRPKTKSAGEVILKAVFLAILAPLAVQAQAQVVEWVAIVHDPPGTTTTRITREFDITQGQATVSRKVTGAIGTGRFLFVDAVRMSPTLWCLTQETGAYLASLAVEIRGDMYTFQPGWINPDSAGQPQAVPGCGSSIDIGPSRIESSRLSALLMVWQ